MATRLIPAFCLVAVPAVAQQGNVGTGTFELVRNRVVLPVYLNEVGPYPFLLDNTAERHVIDTDVAGYLQLPLESVGPSNDFDDMEDGNPKRTTDDVAVHLGGAALGASPAIAMDLKAFASQLGRPVAGVLAGQAFEGMLTLDPPSKAFQWWDSNVPIMDPFTMLLESGDAPRIEVGIGLARLVFRVDTMFEGTARLHSDIILDLGHDENEADSLRMLPSGSNAAGDRFVRLTSLRLGQAELLAPICAVRDAVEEPVLGMGFLRRFRVTFGFPMTFLRIEPLDVTPPRDPGITGLGLVPHRLVDGYWTLEVAADSPAGSAGIAPGDALIAVDGVPMSGQPFAVVQDALRGVPEEESVVVIARDGEQFSFALTARRLL